jgi:hypothetical protein
VAGRLPAAVRAAAAHQQVGAPQAGNTPEGDRGAGRQEVGATLQPSPGVTPHDVSAAQDCSRPAARPPACTQAGAQLGAAVAAGLAGRAAQALTARLGQRGRQAAEGAGRQLPPRRAGHQRCSSPVQNHTLEFCGGDSRSWLEYWASIQGLMLMRCKHPPHPSPRLPPWTRWRPPTHQAAAGPLARQPVSTGSARAPCQRLGRPVAPPTPATRRPTASARRPAPAPGAC